MSRYCSRCGKSHKACICAWIAPLASNIELIILQHPTEAHKPLGTARILALSLANCRILSGENFSDDTELNQLLAEENVQHLVLYPQANAVNIGELGAQLNIGNKRLRVILLDGTWKKAFKIWQLSRNLQVLPCVALPEGLKGEYTIRKAPAEHCLSTVEAGYHILRLLQPEQDFSPLLTTFRNMIQFQIAKMPAGLFERHYGAKD